MKHHPYVYILSNTKATMSFFYDFATLAGNIRGLNYLRVVFRTAKTTKVLSCVSLSAYGIVYMYVANSMHVVYNVCNEVRTCIKWDLCHVLHPLCEGETVYFVSCFLFRLTLVGPPLPGVCIG